MNAAALQAAGTEIGDRLYKLAKRASDEVGAGFPSWHVTVDYCEDEDDGRVYRWHACEVNFEFLPRQIRQIDQAEKALRAFKRLVKAEGMAISDEGGGSTCVGVTVDVRAQGDGDPV